MPGLSFVERDRRPWKTSWCPPPRSRSSGNGGEAALDVEDVASLAPDASIVVYQAHAPELARNISAMITPATRPSAIWMSYALSEPIDDAQARSGFISSENTPFQEAADPRAVGFDLLGNSGSEECDHNEGTTRTGL